LVYHYDSNLPENLLGVTLKYKIDGLIDKLCNILNRLIDRNDLSVKTIELSNRVLETLKIIENCAVCKAHVTCESHDKAHTTHKSHITLIIHKGEVKTKEVKTEEVKTEECLKKFHYFNELINEIEKYLAELEKEEQEKERNRIFDKLVNKLNKTDDELNKTVLCKDCKEIKELTDRCGSKEMARLLY